MKKYFVFLCLSFIFVFSCKHKAENRRENNIKNQFELSFVANSKMGKLNATLDGKTLESKTLITAGKTVSFKAIAKDDYLVDYWKINDKPKYENQEEINVKIEKDTNIVLCFKAKIEPQPQPEPQPKTFKLTYSFNEKEGSLLAEENGKSIESGASLKEGAIVNFKAIAKNDYYVSDWKLNNVSVNNLNSNYELKILKDSHIEVNFSKKAKKEIQVDKIVIGKNEYLKTTPSDENNLKLLENEKEEITISDDKMELSIHLKNPKDAKLELTIDTESPEELQGINGVFEKNDIAITKDFQTFKITLSKDGYNEKNYSFKAKKNVLPTSSIPENLKIKELSIEHSRKKPRQYVEPLDNKIDYNVEYPDNYTGCGIYVHILGENEKATFMEKDKEDEPKEANGKNRILLNPLPNKGETKTFIIVLMYNEEKIEYNLNIHIKKEE